MQNAEEEFSLDATGCDQTACFEFRTSFHNMAVN